MIDANEPAGAAWHCPACAEEIARLRAELEAVRHANERGRAALREIELGADELLRRARPDQAGGQTP